MATESQFDKISLTEQVILLAVAAQHRDEETPVQTHDLRHICQSQLEGVDTEVVGTITEADVMRSLYSLEDSGFVKEVETNQTSPTGKGRPAYTLALALDDVYEGVNDDLLEDDHR